MQVVCSHEISCVHEKFVENQVVTQKFGSPAVHRKQFTANNSPQGRFTAGQFTANNSPQTIHRKQLKSRAVHRRAYSPQTIHRRAIHRRGNLPQGNSPQERFTAAIEQLVFISGARMCKNMKMYEVF
jgi:hypothetical protein